MVYLLIDGDYLLSGVKPSSEEAVKGAVDRLQAAVVEQLLLPRRQDSKQSPDSSASPPYVAQIRLRVVLFSSALINSLSEQERACVISTLRKLRYQTTILESVWGRAGSPVDAALCTKAISFAMMPQAREMAGAADGGNQIFCFVTPNAYIASALDLVTSRGCEVLFAIYEGDEVAEELLGYVSSNYGSGCGIATVPKQDGVVFIPNTEAASAALAALQQEGKDLPLDVLMTLKQMQNSLTKGRSRPSSAIGLKQEGSGVGGSGDSQAAIINASNRKRVEEQQLLCPPPLPPSTGPDLSGSSAAVSTVAAPVVATAITASVTPGPARGGSDDIAQLMTELNGSGTRSSRASTRNDVTVSTLQAPNQQPQLPTEDWNRPELISVPTTLVTTDTSPMSIARNAEEPLCVSVPVSAVKRAGIVPEPKVATELPAGWALLYSKQQQCHYFACTDSRGVTRSTWQHPLGAQKQAELEHQVKLWHQNQDRVHQLQTTAAVASAPAPADPVATTGALPEWWEERIDPQSGRKFYVNHRTKETSWQPPSATPASPPASTTAPSSPAAEPPLPPNWEKRVDERINRTYYIDHLTHQTTWVRPERAAATQPHHQPPAPVAVAQPAAAEEWEARVDPKSGRTYYMNHRTKATSWTSPVRSGGGSGAIAAGANAPPAQPSASSPWESRVDPASGRTYYVNHQTKETSWVRPS